jgi:large subunit ribosomal protein L30
MAEAKMIRIQLVKSPIGSAEKLRKVVRGLGLKKLQSVVVRPDTPEIRGMVNKVPHLVKIVE